MDANLQGPPVEQATPAEQSTVLHYSTQSNERPAAAEPPKSTKKFAVIAIVILCIMAIGIGLLIRRNIYERRVNMAVDMYCIINEARRGFNMSPNMTLSDLQVVSANFLRVLSEKMQPLLKKYGFLQDELEEEAKEIEELMKKDPAFAKKVTEISIKRGCQSPTL